MRFINTRNDRICNFSLENIRNVKRVHINWPITNERYTKRVSTKV